MQEARAGTAAARAILSTAHETHAVARHTAEALHRQTAQLETIAGHVRDTDGILAAAERDIEKLTKPFWRRAGRGLRGSARESAEMWRKRRVKERVDGDVGRVGMERWGEEDEEYEEYEEFDEEVRSELRAQDEILDETGVLVEELRVLAVGIGEEVEKEAEIVEGIDVVEVTSRIREGNRKLRHRLKLK